VFPVRSELAEDEVMATLVAREGAAVDPAEVCAFCVERLPKYAVPRYVEIAADLPRTENGKVQKFVLRERGGGPAAGDRQASSAIARTTRSAGAWCSPTRRSATCRPPTRRPRPRSSARSTTGTTSRSTSAGTRSARRATAFAASGGSAC